MGAYDTTAKEGAAVDGTAKEGTAVDDMAELSKKGRVI